MERRTLHFAGRIVAGFLGTSLLLFATTSKAPAQVLAFSAEGTRRLAELVASDRDVAALFRSLQRTADESLQQTPQPARQLLSEGRLDSDPQKKQTKESLRDMPKLYALGQAYAVTQDKRYAEGAKRFILAWATTTEPTGNPIDATKLDLLISAYAVTRVEMSAAERQTVDGWLEQLAQQQINDRKPNSATSFNNWNSHRMKVIGLIGFVLQDRRLVQAAAEGFRQQVAADLMPDGSSFDFHERDALHYHCYTLEPLLELAIAAQQNGAVGLYQYAAPNGASLAKSVAFLVPFAEGKQQHAEYVNSRVDFDRRRGAAGQKGFEAGAPFDPKTARRTLELASFFEPGLSALVGQLDGTSSPRFSSWQMVLNEVGRQEQPSTKSKAKSTKRATKK